MKRILHLVLIFCPYFIPSISGQGAVGKIDSLMETYYQNGVFNGVVLVSKKGQIIYEKAFGIADREWNIQNTIETKFKIASISKSFTALAVLQLVEAGKLKLDGTIRDYIPDYMGKLGDSITIHQLLTHTSGILTSLDPEEESIRERLYHSSREMINFAESADLYFRPGTDFRYSNLAYNILAYIVETVSGKQFEDILKEKIFNPAGLSDTRHFKTARVENKLARGYEYKLLYGYENATAYDDSYPLGPGSLISTACDLYRFDKALYSDILISGYFKDKIFRSASKGHYGYGWFISEKKINSGNDSLMVADHAGSINGFGSYMARIMSDSSLVVVLKNQRSDTYIEPAFAPDIGKQIISILYGEKVDMPKMSIARHIASLVGTQGVDSAIAEYRKIKKGNKGLYSMEESELNKLGIELYFNFKLPDEALKIFELNMQEYPKSYNTYDSYAFILMKKGDYNKSITFYKKGLAMLKKYPEANDLNAVIKDADKALVYIKEMEQSTKLK